MSHTTPSHVLTVRSNGGLANVLYSDILMSLPSQNQTQQFRGIWDTGASATVITQEIVDALGLQPIGITYVNTASQRNVQTATYLIDVYLRNDLKLGGAIVTLGKLTPGFHCLIGMDIITQGDFSITNYNNTTCMSYRLPSCHEIDYVRTPHMGMASKTPIVSIKQNRNDPCKCGSGRKYKHCCGA